jgi:hypothetical protein
MSLTSKQEAFAQAVASGMSQSDAYRTCYDVGVDTLDETVWEQASRIANEYKVSTRIKALKDEIAEKALWTRLDSVRVLSEIANDTAVRAGEKTGAIKVLNEMQGHNAPKEITINGSLGINVKFD